MCQLKAYYYIYFYKYQAYGLHLEVIYFMFHKLLAVVKAASFLLAPISLLIFLFISYKFPNLSEDSNSAIPIA